MDIFSEISTLLPEFKSIEEKLSSASPVTVVGVTGSQKNHLIYSLCKKTGKKALVVTYDDIESKKIKNDLEFFFNDNVLHFKSKEYVFFDVDISTRQNETDRIKTLSLIKDAPCTVCSISSMMQYTIPLENFKVHTLSDGGSLDVENLIKSLNFLGYKRVGTVEGVGQFSMRGSIVDIFSPSQKNPCRIELFDDVIDSIREFDPITQLSVKKNESFDILPVRELIYSEEKIAQITKKIKDVKNENLYADIEKFEQERYFPSADKYLPFIYDKIPTILDYITDDYIVFIDEPSRVFDKSKTYQKEMGEIVSDMLTKGLFPKNKGEYIADYEFIIDKILAYPLVSIAALSYTTYEYSAKSTVSVSAKTLSSYNGQLSFLKEDLQFWKSREYRTIVLLGNESRLQNLKYALDDDDIESSIITNPKNLPEKGQIFLMLGAIEQGFEYPAAKIAVVSDTSVFVKKNKEHRTKKVDNKEKIRSFDDLSVGDYVVHKSHGIGQYVGIDTLTVDKITKDYIKIKYKSGDYLYVPASQLDLIHKYIGADAKTVKLNRLGGTDWQKTTQRVKESVEALAQDLINLYAERSLVKGHVFSPDTAWQKEFEDTFAFEETPDQLKCIQEVKSDMEKGKCMDRLLCGDVGYGKTEVAMRAAFKCVMEGFQVAYLVPTTILAQQHYNTFSERMKDFAVNIEMLSRFRTKTEQKKIVSRLKDGKVDIIIGTHRLLQNDINFKKLGLLIIDEEQRFGVGHKEKIKNLKKNVSVLTLSATPIPRTLNMAMVGIRDLSVITTPPQDRYPIQTFVLEHNENVIENAISREIARDGQVYYLFNRVEGIESKASELKKLIPDAKIGIAHGKMSESQLEEVMLKLVNNEINVLVCTTIIETGLDISNINTIIIENADCLGLSQLYQLRGRVGRSNRLAYAYLTYRKSKILDNVAQKRLQAVKEFTEFGSGFKIAMRDLEIRGAGNLLGKQQHGNMNLVGYNMYSNLLEQAVKEKKGIVMQDTLQTSVDLNIDAFLPEKYISQEIERIDMYKKIAQICSAQDADEVTDELIDRYGDIPKSAQNLIDIAVLKSMAQKINISEISQKDSMVIFLFEKDIDRDKIAALIKESGLKIMFSSGKKSYLSFKCDENVISNVKIILQKLLN